MTTSTLIATIQAISRHKETILRNVLSWLMPVALCKNVVLPPKDSSESVENYVKRLGKTFQFRVEDETVGSIVFNGWGIPQFFPNHLKILSTHEFMLAQPVIEYFVNLLTKGIDIQQADCFDMLPALKDQEARKYALLDHWEHDAEMAQYALVQVEINRWIRGVFKIATRVHTQDIPEVTQHRAYEPATAPLLSFVYNWRKEGKRLTPEMTKFIAYLSGSSNDRIIGFPEFKRTYLIGIVGEQILAQELGGAVVGSLGKKTDIATFDKNFSVKTTRNAYWQSHLAYLSIADYPQLSAITGNEGSLRDLNFSDEQWAAFVHKFMCAEDNVEYIVFQRLHITESEEVHLKQDLWLCHIPSILQLIREGQYFFRNTSLSIVAPNKEVILSLQFKRRNEGKKIQVMVNTDCHLLKNAAEVVKGISYTLHQQP